MIQHHHDGRFQNERKEISSAPLPGMTVNAKDKYLIADMIPINLTMMPASGSGYRGGCKRPVSSRAILATPGNNRAKTPQDLLP
jgi:hypothetical protein